jgi:NTE family protein
LFPLYYASQSQDILIVEINPLVRPDLPTTARDIADRIDEISFNSALLQDLRAIDFVTRLLDDNKLDKTRYRRLFMHMIATSDDIMRLGPATKYNCDPLFLDDLRRKGHAAADSWIRAHGAALGQHSSIDLHKLVNG